MVKVKTYRIIIIALIAIILTQSLFANDASADNCNTIPTFHLLFLKNIISCLQDSDNILRQDIQTTRQLIDTRLSLVELNQELISNNTGIKTFDTITEYEQSIIPSNSTDTNSTSIE